MTSGGAIHAPPCAVASFVVTIPAGNGEIERAVLPLQGATARAWMRPMIFTNCCQTNMPHDTTFASRGSPLALSIAPIVVLGLCIRMAPRSGGVWLIPTLGILGRKENPVVYWAAIVAAALVPTILFGLTAYAAKDVRTG